MDTIWILGDQLSPEHAALAKAQPGHARVLMIESKARGGLMRYHQIKLALVYSAMRHFAGDLREAGWQVDYFRLEAGLTFETALKRHLHECAPEKVVLAEPNSYIEGDVIRRLGRKLKVPIKFVPTRQFLLDRSEFHEFAEGRQRLLMENHYRRMRTRFGWLMDKKGKPVGGAWNFDIKNRETFSSWKRAHPAIKPDPREKPDELSQEVIAMVAREFPKHPGKAEDLWLPVDRAGALRWLKRFIKERLPTFGVYEDIMVTGAPVLFHSVLSPMLNLGLLTPRECIEAAVSAYENGEAPLNSVEGFVRQIIGWREFINGVYWHRGPEYKELNALGAERPLPKWIYTAETRMNCLHQTLRQTLALGYNHHIQRLMVLGNFFLISGINPQEALRWYLEMYVDAFDWVMAANVIGMALFADGGYMATKPYAATSGYIRKMSDYCKGCQFDPDEKTGPKACPFNYLYWNFIDQHSDRFQEIPRMRPLVTGWLDRGRKEQETVRDSAQRFFDGEWGR